MCLIHRNFVRKSLSERDHCSFTAKQEENNRPQQDVCDMLAHHCNISYWMLNIGGCGQYIDMN